MIEYFNPQCQPEEVIIMESAKYGRMNVGKCIDSDRELGCYADVIDTFDNMCSFKKSCSVQVGSNDFESKSTCWDESLQYLEAAYVCRKGKNMLCSINYVVNALVYFFYIMRAIITSKRYTHICCNFQYWQAASL